MSSSVTLSDGKITVVPGALGYAPELASGITLTDATTGGNHTQTLTAGATYVAMADATAGGNWLLGVADVTTAANAIWFVPVSSALCFHMPVGQATLNYECLANGGKLYLVKVLT